MMVTLHKKRYDLENEAKETSKILVKRKEDTSSKELKASEAEHAGGGEVSGIGWRGCSRISIALL